MRLMRSTALAIFVTAAFGIVACEGGDDGAPAPVTERPDAEPGNPAARCAPGRKTADWPAGPYAIELMSVLPPDLAWDGPKGPVLLKDYYEPCASRSRLLVVRSSPLWCGTCDWHIRHTQELLGAAPAADRVRLVDLLLADEDNMPPTPDAAARLQTLVAAPGVDSTVAMDANYKFASVIPGKSALPVYALIDTRTMKVTAALSNPSPETLVGFVVAELASLDGSTRPDLPSPKLHDDLLTEDQFDLLKSMALPSRPPADPTNEVADSSQAAALGEKLFRDVSLSPSNKVACVTCHDPQKAFGDAVPQSMGVAMGDRNAPPIALSAHARWQFWDGRADTLWMQALGPFENAKEFASSRLFVAHAVVDRYRSEYEAIFGAKYPLPDLSAAPPAGKPGDPLYEALSKEAQRAITRVYVNVGKSIAAFERSIRVQPNALDRYIEGDNAALNAAQKRGLRGFFVAGCAQCHWGPRLTDDAFHAIGFPTGRQDRKADRGRADVLLGLASAEFVASSDWSDAPSAAKQLLFASVPPAMVGAFKTPTLRGVAQSAPFGHGGSLPALEDVARHYGERGEKVAPGSSTGVVEPWLPEFDSNAQAELPAFLEVLRADPL